MDHMNTRPLFEKYQHELLKLVNTPFGKEYLGDISKAFKNIDEPIVKITPESIHVVKGLNKKKQPIIQAIFIIKPKLLWAFQRPLLEMEKKERMWGNQISQEVQVPHLFGLFKGVDFSRFVPGLTTTTFNPAPGDVSGYDGTTNVLDFTATTFANARAMSGVGVDTSGATLNVQLLENGGIFRMQRAITLFDTSSLTTLATINSATYELYPTTVTNQFAGGDSIAIALPNPASTSTLAATDYNIERWTMIAQATALTLASITLNTYNTWTLNATGLSNISKTGITKFGFVSQFDLSNTDPGDPGAGTNGTQFFVHSADEVNDPKLVVTYTLGTGYTQEALESITLTDTTAKITAMIRLETLALVDTLTRQSTKVLTDTITLVQASFVTGYVYFKTLSDTINIEQEFDALLNGVSALWKKIAKTSGGVWTKQDKP